MGCRYRYLYIGMRPSLEENKDTAGSHRVRIPVSKGFFRLNITMDVNAERLHSVNIFTIRKMLKFQVTTNGGDTEKYGKFLLI